MLDVATLGELIEDCGSLPIPAQLAPRFEHAWTELSIPADARTLVADFDTLGF